MRIVIAGCGKIGKAITGSLVADGHEVVVIDSKPEVIKTVSNTYDIMGISGKAQDSVGRGGEVRAWLQQGL